MRSARTRAPAKVNLALRVLAREDSGYHQLETVFQALDVDDEVHVWGHDFPDKPSLHVKEYDQIIRRMDLSLDKEIFLKHGDFDKFVLDEWSWTEAHRDAHTQYSNNA